MQTTSKLVFTNELGNVIQMQVVVDERGVTVEASGPTSQIEHTWTPLEAENLFRMLLVSREAERLKKLANQ